MVALKIKTMVIDCRFKICRQLRANLLQLFQWPEEDTHFPERSIFPSDGSSDSLGRGDCVRILGLFLPASGNTSQGHQEQS